MTEVMFVVREFHKNPYQGITHLGGGLWRWTVDMVIKSIESDTNTFYTEINGVRAEVAIINGPDGKYLRTHADGVWTDHLLRLPNQ